MQANDFSFVTNHQKFKKREIFLLTISFTLFISQLTPQIICGILMEFSAEEYINGLIIQLFWCGSGFYIATHCILLYSVQLRFETLNQILKNRNEFHELMILSSLYVGLCELVIKLNKMSSYQILSFIGLNIINTTFSLFEIYDLFNHKISDGMKIFFSFGVIWFCCFFFVHIIMVIAFSTLLATEESKMIQIINEIIHKKKEFFNEKILKRFQIFLMQLDHLNAKVSCEFFTLDWKTLMMVSKILHVVWI